MTDNRSDAPTAEQTHGTADAQALKDRILDAALLHVPFDGWSDTTLAAAIADTGTDAGTGRALFPRGALDLALAFHAWGDAQMVARMREADLGQLRLRDRIAAAIRFRLEAAQDKESVRRGVTFFALPQNAAEGARAIWGTCDLIWDTLGDTSEDINWYSKRTILSGVYSSTLLFWLGDNSVGDEATWSFLDRRIEDVMRFEKVKAALNRNPVLRAATAGPRWVLGQVRAPLRAARPDMPGYWQRDI